MKQKPKNILAALFLSLLLPACTSTESITIDRDAASVESKLLNSPASNAVVGMWFNKIQSSAGGVIIRNHQTMLFKSDGTGLSRSTASGSHSFTDTVPFTWRYVGGGSWSVTSHSPGYPPVTTTFQTDGTRLLNRYVINGTSVKKVFVRGDDSTAVNAEQRTMR